MCCSIWWKKNPNLLNDIQKIVENQEPDIILVAGNERGEINFNLDILFLLSCMDEEEYPIKRGTSTSIKGTTVEDLKNFHCLCHSCFVQVAVPGCIKLCALMWYSKCIHEANVYKIDFTDGAYYCPECPLHYYRKTRLVEQMKKHMFEKSYGYPSWQLN